MAGQFVSCAFVVCFAKYSTTRNLQTAAELSVRPSFSKVSGSQMSGFRKALEFWFDAQGMGILSGFNAHRTNSTARSGSYSGLSGWLSVLRQPAHHRAAPKCHSPSAFWLNTLGGLPLSQSVWHTAFKHQRERLVQRHCSSNHCTFAVCSTPSTSRHSLTVRSRGRLHHRASCLRQTGAPYLCS